MRNRSVVLIAALAVLVGLIIALWAYAPGRSSPKPNDPACSAEQSGTGNPAHTAISKGSPEKEITANNSAANSAHGEDAATPPVETGDDENPNEPAAADTQPGGPYTASHHPKLDEVRDLPIGAARKPAPPEYASSLDDDKWRVYDTTPNLDYRDKLTRLIARRGKVAERIVHGRVFEIIGGKRIPLSGVLVRNRGWNRTFTDDSGRFELLAYWTVPDAAEREQGIEYEISLSAWAHGYIGLTYQGPFTNLDETDDGFDLFLVRRDTGIIRVNFDNPQAAGDVVTVILADNENADIGQAVDWDEKRYIVAKVNPMEECWFGVPLHYDRAADYGYGLRSVSAPNVLMDITNLQITRTQTETTYLVTLLVEDTVAIHGTAVDLQTGEPVPHARVQGPGVTEFTVADAQGRFDLISSKTPRGPSGEVLGKDERFFRVADERYATLTSFVRNKTLEPTDTGGLILGPGGGLAGPWTVQLRRWVEADVDCTFLAPESRDGARLELTFDTGVEGARTQDLRQPVGADGICHFERMPWGTQAGQLLLSNPFGSKAVEFDAASWNGHEPFQPRTHE